MFRVLLISALLAGMASDASAFGGRLRQRWQNRHHHASATACCDAPQATACCGNTSVDTRIVTPEPQVQPRTMPQGPVTPLPPAPKSFDR